VAATLAAHDQKSRVLVGRELSQRRERLCFASRIRLRRSGRPKVAAASARVRASVGA
jgi:hypothetical protein